jgi:putative membrane protein
MKAGESKRISTESIRSPCWFVVAIFLLSPLSLAAHSDSDPARPHNLRELVGAWEFDLPIIIPLFLSLWFYFVGVARLWEQTHIGGGIRRVEIGCFLGGWLALFIALVSPLHPWGRVLFSAHMSQHEILMLLAAPLLVLSRPLLAFLKALPARRARHLAAAAHNPSWQPFWKFITNAFVAWLIHAIALWIWHVPALFNATIDNDLVHSLQHVSFLGSALLFWWAIIHGPRRAMSYGVAVLYMFTTAMHSGLLGALLSYTTTPWYPAYANTTQSWGLTPIEDQQLGGLIMWVPAGLVYVFAALILMVAWMRDSERRVIAREAQPMALRP